MRARAGLYLVLPALVFSGCASKQTIDAQSAARQQLEDRIAKLETDQAAQTARLNQLGPTSSELKNQLDALRNQFASQQSVLSALSGKADIQGTTLTALSGKVEDQGTALTALSGKVEDQGTALTALSGKADAQAITLSELSGKVDDQGTALTALSGKADTQATTLSELSGKADTQATTLTALSGKVDNQATAVAQAKETANDAVKIARDSRMVSGKIIDSQLLTDDMVLYNYEQPELTAKGKVALDELIKRAVPQLPYIFIEIIGYSDDISLGSQNRRIALERAESVRRYLFEVGRVPLHRMSVISYGDLKPLTSNDSLEGRSRNRRVTVQVLK